MSGTADPLRTRLRRALPAAMKARDGVALAALRSALAAIDNAEAVVAPVPSGAGSDVIPGAVTGLGAGEAPRLELTDAQIAAVVRDEVAERRDTAAAYERAGRADAAARLRAEADVLAGHLGDAAG